jgi:hypothetical protein
MYELGHRLGPVDVLVMAVQGCSNGGIFKHDHIRAKILHE